MKKEWNITWENHDGYGGTTSGMVILPSFWKVLWWFIKTGRKACDIYIWTSVRNDEWRNVKW